MIPARRLSRYYCCRGIVCNSRGVVQSQICVLSNSRSVYNIDLHFPTARVKANGLTCRRLLCCETCVLLERWIPLLTSVCRVVLCIGYSKFVDLGNSQNHRQFQLIREVTVSVTRGFHEFPTNSRDFVKFLNIYVTFPRFY